MKHITTRTSILAAALTGFIAIGSVNLSSPDLAVGAPAEAGGGGGAHVSAPAGGGGAAAAHVSAPAAQPHASAPVQQAQPAHTNLTPPAAAQQSTVHTASPTGTVTNSGAAANRGVEHRLSGAGNEHRIFNPYRVGANRNNQSVGVYSSYPWYPFSYGYNTGWYGNNYGNAYGGNSYPFYIPTDETANNDNDPNEASNTVQQTQQAPAAVAQPAPTAPVQQGQPGITPDVQAQITNAIEKSPAMVSANNSVQLAQSALDRERERVLAALREKPEYQAALDRRHQAVGAVRTARQTGATGSDAVASAADEKLEAGDEVTKMEEQAIAADPAASAAKGRLDQAIADRNAERADLTVQYQSAAH